MTCRQPAKLNPKSAELDQALPRPRYGELLIVIGLGTIHVIVELAFSLATTRVYNAAVLTLGLAYLIRRAVTTPGILYQWGLRTDNFWVAIRCHSLFGGLATAGLLLWGIVQERPLVPQTLWVVLLLYPFFGMAQQFILQNLVVSHLRGLIRKPAPCAFVAALLFGLSHVPRVTLSIAAFVAGFFLTLTYQRHPNILAAGIVHGYLAALCFYLVLGSDPGARILEGVGSIFTALRGLNQ